MKVDLMSSIIVTGGLGFVGSHVVVELVTSGFNPVIIDNCSNSNLGVLANLNRICGTELSCLDIDISRDTEALAKVFEDIRPKAVIHCAAKKYVSESILEPLSYYENNVGGILGLLAVMRRFGCGILIFSSSACVYGHTDTIPITEECPMGSVSNPYAYSKQVCERVICDEWNSHQAGAVAMLRYFNPAGGHSTGLLGEDFHKDTQTNLFPSILRAIKAGKKITIHGYDHQTVDGTPLRDFIHVVDLARGHIACLIKLLDSVGVFIWNLGTGRGISVLDVVNEFNRQYSGRIDYEVGPRRLGDISVSYADVKKARADLGWEAQKTLADMVSDALYGAQLVTQPQND